MSLNFSSVSPGLTAIADGLGGALLAWKSYQTDTDPVDQGADVVALESSLLGAVQGLMSVTGELGDSFATGLNPVAVAGALINGAQASMQISAAATQLQNATTDAQKASAQKAMDDATAAIVQDVGTLLMVYPPVVPPFLTVVRSRG